MTLASTALIIVDLQNDFLHPDGAYGRAGQTSPAIAALPTRLKPLADQVRRGGGIVVATLFTLVPGRDGKPMISPHLKVLRPFLTKNDFASGSWGQQVVDELAPVDFAIEKVAYSGFYMTRMEWVLRKCGIANVYVSGIVTNGGVASTARDAHVRDFECTVLEDGCATFSEPLHAAAIESLRSIARIKKVEQALKETG